MHNLPGFFHHFPFFLGVGIIQENIYFRQYVKSYLVRVDMGHNCLPVQYQFRLVRSSSIAAIPVPDTD
jgi:hypothetical protein